MIFATVGHQMPFDRLIRKIDEWANASGKDVDVFAQIGETRYQPQHIQFVSWLSPTEFAARLRKCSAVVSHAGTGTIIQSLMLGKPILVVPRLSRLGETRNDHQVATAAKFAERAGVLVGADESSFNDQMAKLCSSGPRPVLSDSASPELIETIRRFIATAI